MKIGSFTPKRLYLLHIIWLGVLALIGIQSFEIFTILFFLTIGFVFAPFFRLETTASYTSDKTREEVIKDFTGKNSLLVEMNNDKAELESYKDGTYVLTGYPTKIHEFLDRENRLEIESGIEKDLEESRISLNGELVATVNSEIMEKEGKTRIAEKAEYASRENLIYALLTSTEKKRVENKLSEHNYDLQSWSINLKV